MIPKPETNRKNQKQPKRKTPAANTHNILSNGGTCLAAPDGSRVIKPFPTDEKLIVAKINQRKVCGECQNLDIAGHYSCPDVLQLKVNRRQSIFKFDE